MVAGKNQTKRQSCHNVRNNDPIIATDRKSHAVNTIQRRHTAMHAFTFPDLISTYSDRISVRDLAVQGCMSESRAEFHSRIFYLLHQSFR